MISEDTFKNVLVTKASGEKTHFSEQKIYRSLENAGADPGTIDQIITTVKGELYEGITTKYIYRRAFDLLKRQSPHTAAKYKLKQAIMELGPSGYPFERYIAEILRYQEYRVEVGQIVKGHCVNHEIDVIAQRDKKHFMIECKFHNRPGFKCNVKTPLYINSRFLDVEKVWKNQPGHYTRFHQGWLVTNTKFTEDAIQYGNCVGLHLIGWDYPKQGSLKQRIDISGLHPLTCLTTLTKREKQTLLKRGVVLAKELYEQDKILIDIGIKSVRRSKILNEAEKICVIEQ